MRSICLTGSNAQLYAIIYVIELKRTSIVVQTSIAQFCGIRNCVLLARICCHRKTIAIIILVH